MKKDVANVNEMQLNEVERKYEIIQRREKIIKRTNNLSLLILFISVAVLLLYPCFIVGDEKLNILTYFINYFKKDSVAIGIENAIMPIVEDVWLKELLLFASIWYVAFKIIILVFSFVFLVLKFLFGGFIISARKKSSYQYKEKIVNKYIKKNKHGILKKIALFIGNLALTSIFPPIAEFMDIKDSATSGFLPILYSLMLILFLCIPFSSASGLTVSGMALSFNMTPIYIATVFGVMHTLMPVVLFFIKSNFALHKIDK